MIHIDQNFLIGIIAPTVGTLIVAGIAAIWRAANSLKDNTLSVLNLTEILREHINDVHRQLELRVERIEVWRDTHHGR